MKPAPIRLETNFHEKIWGATDLAPWFCPSAKRIGEVSFSLPGHEALPLLVKFLFTSERLSIQVHPDEGYAQVHEGSGGKTEMWYVLRAEPGARLAAGFSEPVSRERVREAALSDEIEGLLRWFPVSPGQVYFVPAGTVHTLGPGLAVCEIQQNNPITYRLYDFGRARALHLDRALDVVTLEPYPGPIVPEGNLLASCRYFMAERMEVASLTYQPDAVRFHLLIVLEGRGRIGAQHFAPGETWYIPAGAEAFLLAAEPRAILLRTYVP